MRTKNIVKAFEMLLDKLDNQNQGSREEALRELKEKNYSVYYLIKSATLDSRIIRDLEKIEENE